MKKEWAEIEADLQFENFSIKRWNMVCIPLTVTFLFSAFAFGQSGACKKHLRLVGEIFSYLFLFIL